MSEIEINGPKTVLVLGSAPNAIILEADHVYCANASAYYYAESLKSFLSIKTVVGAHIVAATPESGAPPALKTLRQRVLDCTHQDVIVLDFEKWYDGWDLFPTLTSLKSSDTVQMSVLTADDRSDILRTVANISEPVFSLSLYREAKSIRDFVNISKAILRAKQKSRKEKGSEANPVFRPSTGIWALLIAIGTHGPNAKYLLSGVTLTDQGSRLPHPDGRSPGGFKSKLSHHLHADKQLFGILQKKYSLELL